MSEALTLFRYIWSKIITTVFNTFQVETGVSIGWIVLVVGVIGMVIRSILYVPKGINFNRRERPERNENDTNN